VIHADHRGQHVRQNSQGVALLLDEVSLGINEDPIDGKNVTQAHRNLGGSFGTAVPDEQVRIGRSTLASPDWLGLA
jgi:hypothetical protein